MATIYTAPGAAITSQFTVSAGSRVSVAMIGSMLFANAVLQRVDGANYRNVLFDGQPVELSPKNNSFVIQQAGTFVFAVANPNTETFTITAD
jgi:xanthine/CO dehydrogenase XdhC/CoxF family maturation factor